MRALCDTRARLIRGIAHYVLCGSNCCKNVANIRFRCTVSRAEIWESLPNMIADQHSMLLNKITPLYFVVSCSGTRFALESSSLQRLVVSGPYVNTGALLLYRWCSREGCKRLASTKFRLQHKCHPCCANNRRVSLSDFPCR